MSTLRYVLTSDADVDAVLAGLDRDLEVATGPTRRVRRTLADTFDWRVWGDGGVVEVAREAAAGSGTLVWRDRRTGEVRGRIEGVELPLLATDLGDAPVADRLGEVLDVRALEPLVTVSGSTTELRVLDDETKTVARIIVERLRADVGGQLPTSLELRPVRGYDAELARTAAALDALDGVRTVAESAEAAALAAAGRTPGSYSSKLRLTLEPEATAGQAFVTVLRALRTAMDRNEEGTRADRDSEYLHDYRVAVRRTRSVLAQAKGVLDPEALARWKEGFRWLGAVTSPTRDLDVWLLTLPDLAEGIDPALAHDLDPLAEQLARAQRRAQRRLVRDLDRDRYRDLLAAYDAWLADPATPGGAGDATPDADRPAPAVCGARIATAFRRVERDGRRIDDDTPAEALHTLRKDAKKLRYALECYGSLFATDDVAPLVKDLKALQNVLGDFQDGEVQAGSLREHAEALVDGGAGAGVVLAMGALVELLAERQEAARAAFAARFERFDSKANRRRVRRIATTGEART